MHGQSDVFMYVGTVPPPTPSTTHTISFNPLIMIGLYFLSSSFRVPLCDGVQTCVVIVLGMTITLSVKFQDHISE